MHSPYRRQRLAFLIVAIVVAASPVAGPVPARADDTAPLVELVATAAQRLEVAEPVAAFKWNAHLAIEAPDRVERQLGQLVKQAREKQIDPDYVARVFRDQISASEAIQYQRFAQWKLDPALRRAQAPATAPDLAASRVAIDALNNKILSQISLDESLLRGPACAGQLEIARVQTILARHFDDLYQRALRTATRSYCRVL